MTDDPRTAGRRDWESLNERGLRERAETAEREAATFEESLTFHEKELLRLEAENRRLRDALTKAREWASDNAHDPVAQYDLAVIDAALGEGESA